MLFILSLNKTTFILKSWRDPNGDGPLSCWDRPSHQIAIFADNTITNAQYSGWIKYTAPQKTLTHQLFVGEQVQSNDITFDTRATKVAHKYGFDYLNIDTLRQSQYYLDYNWNIAYSTNISDLKLS